MAQSLGIGVIPYSPTGGGLLTGKYGVGRRTERGPPARHEDVHDALREPGLLRRSPSASPRSPPSSATHPATLAVAWVASHPAVTSVLVGGRNVEQLAPTLAASDVELDAETRARISALSPAPAAGDRPQRRDVPRTTTAAR